MAGFDPYLVWLDISPQERPVTHYRLLGLRPLESDPQVITTAAQRVIDHVARFQQSENAAACHQMLSEVMAARDCLLDPVRKQAYDSGFSQSGLASPPSAPGEQPLRTAPQVPGGAGNERQISSTPPVPQSPAQSGHVGPSAERPLPPSTVPTSPVPNSAAPVSAAGVPSSVQPQTNPTNMPREAALSQPVVPSASPMGAPPSAPQVTQQPIPHSIPHSLQHGPTAPSLNPPTQPPPEHAPPEQPPTWAQSQRTGEVGTVVAGQASAQAVSSSKTQHGRQLRRTQRAQSAYLMVGIAMAMIVFFFGAVLVLAIYMGG